MRRRSCSGRSSTCGTRTTSRARRPIRPSTVSASARFIGLAAQNGRPDLGIDFGINGTGLFGPARVDDWLEIMPWIRHVHGKFFGIDENGEEPSVPVRDLIRLLVENGYNGAISSEYEGWHWNYWQSPFEIIARRAGRAALGCRRRGLAHDHGCRRGARHPQHPPGPARPRLNTDTLRNDIMTDDNGIAGTGIKLGITLYSLTSEFAAGLYTPETLIKAAADHGLGPGIEFNIAQMLRTYPDVDDEFVKLWRDSMDRYGLEPSAIGTNLDMGRRKDRDMTPDEEHEFLARQLKTAHTLGFKKVVIRSHGKELLRSLLPLAEKYDQKLGYEIHAPSGSEQPAGAADARDVRRAAVRPPRLHGRLLIDDALASLRRCCARSARWAWTRSTSPSWTRSGTSPRPCTCATRSSRTS